MKRGKYKKLKIVEQKVAENLSSDFGSKLSKSYLWQFNKLKSHSISVNRFVILEREKKKKNDVKKLYKKQKVNPKEN